MNDICDIQTSQDHSLNRPDSSSLQIFLKEELFIFQITQDGWSPDCYSLLSSKIFLR